MSTTAVTTSAAPVSDPDADVADCACHLYDAECALHAAHQSGVDAWIEAATEKLHQAVIDHTAAVTARDAAHGPGDRS